MDLLGKKGSLKVPTNSPFAPGVQPVNKAEITTTKPKRNFFILHEFLTARR